MAGRRRRLRTHLSIPRASIAGRTVGRSPGPPCGPTLVMARPGSAAGACPDDWQLGDAAAGKWGAPERSVPAALREPRPVDLRAAATSLQCAGITRRPGGPARRQAAETERCLRRRRRRDAGAIRELRAPGPYSAAGRGPDRLADGLRLHRTVQDPHGADRSAVESAAAAAAASCRPAAPQPPPARRAQRWRRALGAGQLRSRRAGSVPASTTTTARAGRRMRTHPDGLRPCHHPIHPLGCAGRPGQRCSDPSHRGRRAPYRGSPAAAPPQPGCTVPPPQTPKIRTKVLNANSATRA